MSTACLVGTTGLVGSHIFETLSKHPKFNNIYAYSRRESPISEKLKPLTSTDTSTWPSLYPKDCSILFSALGTSRAKAGGVENQRKIDYDLNLNLAKAAKEAGTKCYVLISSSGANASSSFAYMKMKGELDEAVGELGFDHVVILRPGFLLGQRDEWKNAVEPAMQKVAGFLGSISGNRMKDVWAQDADVVAKAAVRAGLDALDGKQTEKVRILGQADVVRLGRTEWKDGE